MRWLTVISLCFVLTLLDACKSSRELPTVIQVDPEKYMGRWYELASFPIRPQKHCTCTYAEYGLTESGFISVYNHCLDSTNQKVKDIRGKAFTRDSSFSKLDVQFFWPFKSPYFIIDLDTINYNYALVGNPSRENLWILSRGTSLGNDTLNGILQKAVELDFDTSRLTWTKHNCR